MERIPGGTRKIEGLETEIMGSYGRDNSVLRALACASLALLNAMGCAWVTRSPAVRARLRAACQPRLEEKGGRDLNSAVSQNNNGLYFVIPRPR